MGLAFLRRSPMHAPHYNIAELSLSQTNQKKSPTPTLTARTSLLPGDAPAAAAIWPSHASECSHHRRNILAIQPFYSCEGLPQHLVAFEIRLLLGIAEGNPFHLLSFRFPLLNSGATLRGGDPAARRRPESTRRQCVVCYCSHRVPLSAATDAALHRRQWSFASLLTLLLSNWSVPPPRALLRPRPPAGSCGSLLSSRSASSSRSATDEGSSSEISNQVLTQRMVLHNMKGSNKQQQRQNKLCKAKV